MWKLGREREIFYLAKIQTEHEKTMSASLEKKKIETVETIVWSMARDRRTYVNQTKFNYTALSRYLHRKKQKQNTTFLIFNYITRCEQTDKTKSMKVWNWISAIYLL